MHEEEYRDSLLMRYTTVDENDYKEQLGMIIRQVDQALVGG